MSPFVGKPVEPALPPHALTTDLTSEPAKPDETMSSRKLTVDAELEKLQRETFGYFLHETNPANGLVIDKTAPDWPSSIAAAGLALACYPVSVERGFMSRTAAVERTLVTLRFFWHSPQGPESDATGFHGWKWWKAPLSPWCRGCGSP